MRNRTRRALGVIALIIVLALATFMAVSAQGDTPAAATLLVDQTSESGQLTGSRAGSFHYYTINNPGDGRVITVEMTFVPADPVTREGVGFHVYGPNGFFIGSGESVDDMHGTLRLLYSDFNPATWLVQVYNYVPNQTINYTVKATGLPTPPPTPVAGETPTPAPVLGAGARVTSSLSGDRAGSYDVYEFYYPGVNQAVDITLRFAPADPIIARGVGFVVYGPSGEAARGASQDVAGEKSASFSSSQPGVYMIQVYNYIAGLTVSYTLEGTYGETLGLVHQAQIDLQQRSGVRVNDIQVVSITPTDFPDASLGVPEPGKSYIQVITPGYVILLRANNQVYEYHASSDRVVLASPR